MVGGSDAPRFGCRSGVVRADGDGGRSCILADRQSGYGRGPNCPVCSRARESRLPSAALGIPISKWKARQDVRGYGCAMESVGAAGSAAITVSRSSRRLRTRNSVWTATASCHVGST